MAYEFSVKPSHRFAAGIHDSFKFQENSESDAAWCHNFSNTSQANAQLVRSRAT
jgi:hypothetical protein